MEIANLCLVIRRNEALRTKTSAKFLATFFVFNENCLIDLSSICQIFQFENQFENLWTIFSIVDENIENCIITIFRLNLQVNFTLFASENEMEN